MHYAQLRSCSACFVSVELGLSNDSFYVLLQLKNGWAAPREQQTNEANDRNLGKKKLAGYDKANNKVTCVLIQEGYLCPCLRRWALTRSPRTFANLKVLGKKDRRSLEVASAVPWFWTKDRQSLPTFVSFMYVSMGGMSGKHSAELKTPRRRGQHLRRWNQRQSERFYQTSAESLEVACTLRSFLKKKKSKKSNFMLLCTKWSGKIR